MESSKSKSLILLDFIWLVVIAIASAVLAADSAAAESSPILSTTISLAEWAIADPSSIRLGRLGIAREPEGESLRVYVLRSEAPRALAVGVASAKPQPAGNCFVVAELSGGNQNRLGGYFNVFQRAPSSARFDIDRRGHGRRTLRLSYHRAASGFCGFWMHFYDFVREPMGPRTYLDASDFGILSLWVRGREGGERLLLKLADRRLDRLGDSLAIGELGAGTPSGGLTTAWQRSVVSLHDLPTALDPTHLASLTLEATAGRGAVELSRIALCRTATDLPPLPDAELPAAASRLSKAVWVWNTRDLLERPEDRAEFLSFLDSEGFDQVYLQLPNRTGVPARLANPGAGPTPLAALVAAIRGLGLAVYALDGHATFVMPDQQDEVLGTIRDIAAFNATVPEGERFTGVHYDIEPYLLPGFGGSRREEILSRYLDLLARMAVELRKTDLRLGVDLPFWFDAPDEFSQDPLMIAFAGQRKMVTEHVLNLVDQVTLMDYRTSAYGPDGILFHAAGELEVAARLGKQITLGLETGRLPDETYLTFAGEARTGMPAGGELGDWVFLTSRGAEAILTLVRQDQWESFQRFLASHPEEHRNLRFWAVSDRLEIPATKLSFAELGSGALTTAMRQVAYELKTSPSFAGFALHHYASLREWGPRPAGAARREATR